MGIFNDKWNTNNFSIYKSEEKTVLKLFEKLNNFIGELTQGVDQKTDINGDHKGSWQGLERPTMSEEGMRATVEKIEKEFGNIGNIVIDNIQNIINNALENREIIINNSFNVDSITIENKNNIKICGSGKINQVTNNYQVQTSETVVSNFALFKIRNCNNLIIEGINFSSKFESVDIQSSNNIKFINCVFEGKDNTSLFNGVVGRDSTNISFEKCTIKNFSKMPTYNTSAKLNNYSLGEGIAFYNVDGVFVKNCYVHNNAKNGVYTYGCKNVIVDGNNIFENGMSGIQLAFAFGNETNYSIDNNIIEANYSDGIDINNTMPQSININCTINNNKYKNNGWFNKNKEYITQDGSGVATLVNVNGVKGKGNIVNDCCRAGLYIKNCEDIDISYDCNKSKEGVGNVLYIGKAKNVNVFVNGKHRATDDNAIAFDSNFGDLENISVSGYIESDYMLPHYSKGNNKFINVKLNNLNTLSKSTVGNTIFQNLIYENCTFRSTNATGINIGDDTSLSNCNIISDTKEGLYSANKVKLINCSISSPTYAMINWNKSNNVFSNCIFNGNNGVRVSGGENVIFENCKCNGIDGQGIHVLDNAKVVVNNCTLYSKTSNSIRVENGCTIKYGENIELAPSDFTTSTKKTITWV